MEAAGVTRPLPGLRLLFVGGSVLVALAGIQLFVFSERTDEFFAWTIASPLTAAVDGAFFLAALALLLPAARAASWAEVRPVAFTVLVIATVKLIATLLDLEPFHFEGPETAARLTAWSWLVVYIIVPAALVALLVAQVRAPGRDPEPGPPLPRGLAAALVLVAVAMLAIGALQLFASAAAADIWPWPLTALTSHALSAWFLGVGMLAALTVRDNDLLRSRTVLAGAVILGVLLAVSIVRHEPEVDWDRFMAWAFVALIAVLVVTGAYGLLAARRQTAS